MAERPWCMVLLSLKIVLDLGVIDGGSRRGGLIRLGLALRAHPRAWLALRPAGPTRWRGRMIAAGRRVPVTLVRD